jgi:hypothetical protein
MEPPAALNRMYSQLALDVEPSMAPLVRIRRWARYVHVRSCPNSYECADIPRLSRWAQHRTSPSYLLRTANTINRCADVQKASLRADCCKKSKVYGATFFRKNMHETLSPIRGLNRIAEVALELDVRRRGPSHLYTKFPRVARQNLWPSVLNDFGNNIW